jgi:hypothetical protein
MQKRSERVRIPLHPSAEKPCREVGWKVCVWVEPVVFGVDSSGVQ